MQKVPRARSSGFGPMIGQRKLRTPRTAPKTVTVSLGQPRLPKGKTDWECPFRISGGGIRGNESGYGVDAIQALQNALGSIRSVLDQSSQSFEWLGLPLDVAFPRSIPSYGDERLTKRLEKLMDRELERNVTRLRRRHQRKQTRTSPSDRKR